MATRLQNLSIDETSGVENPANELPGFLVMKSKDASPEELLKAVDRMESDYAILYSALKACEQYMGDAPQEVSAAKDTLVSFIESLFADTSAGNGSTDATAAPADAGGAQPVAASAGGDPIVNKETTTVEPKPTLMERIFGVRKAEGEPKTDALASQEPVEEPAAEAGQAEVEPVQPTAPPEEPYAEEPGKASGPPEPEQAPAAEDDEGVQILKHIAETLRELKEGQDVQKDAIAAVADRVSSLEVRKTSIDTDIVLDDEIAKSSETRGTQALRSALLTAAQGQRVTIG